MSQFSFDSEALEEAQTEPLFDLQADTQFDTHFEPQEEPQAPEAVAEPVAEAIAEGTTEPVAAPDAPTETLALSVDDFAALEERILRAVNLVKRERLARAAAEERAAQAEALLLEQSPKLERLQDEVQKLHAERDHVRQRVERLLAQLDVLEL
jgi:hypothetical protein